MGRNKKKGRKALVEGSDIEDSDDSGSDHETKEGEAPAAPPAKKRGAKVVLEPPSAQAGPAAASSAPPSALAEPAQEAPVAVTRLWPQVVTYCPTCTFPAEMCEYSGMFEKCKPWLAEQMAADEASALAEAEEKGRKRRVLTEQERIDGLLSGKGKKKVEQSVVLEVKVRSGKKKVTLVHGLDLFGHNMEDVARQLKKVFCCGAGVTSSPGQLDYLEIQGDFIRQLLDMLPAKYNIPATNLYYMDGKTKICAVEGS